MAKFTNNGIQMNDNEKIVFESKDRVATITVVSQESQDIPVNDNDIAKEE